MLGRRMNNRKYFKADSKKLVIVFCVPCERKMARPNFDTFALCKIKMKVHMSSLETLQRITVGGGAARAPG